MGSEAETQGSSHSTVSRCMFGTVQVRAASRDDLDAIRTLMLRAPSGAYGEMLPPSAIRAEAHRRYQGSLLREKLLAGDLLVGEDASGEIEMVTLVSHLEDRIALRTVLAASDPAEDLSAEPLVQAMRNRGWLEPVVCDVVLGNSARERFLENAGFAPGDVVAEDVQGHPVFWRTWWLQAVSSTNGDG